MAHKYHSNILRKLSLQKFVQTSHQKFVNRRAHFTTKVCEQRGKSPHKNYGNSLRTTRRKISQKKEAEMIIMEDVIFSLMADFVANRGGYRELEYSSLRNYTK